ncbi:hypothetical protein C5167_015824, partial [Papaver somniferum]
MENEYIYRHHTHDGMRNNRCSSALVKHIKDPLHLGTMPTRSPPSKLKRGKLEGFYKPIPKEAQKGLLGTLQLSLN